MPPPITVRPVPIARPSDRDSIARTLANGARSLAAAGIDNPRLEARLLLAHALGWSTEALIRDLAAPTPDSEFDQLLARRAAREPLAYITGRREFWSLSFRVSPATLIPRPESETVVEAALALFPERSAPVRALDLGTGSGCLLLAFLHERAAAFGVGVDRSEAAARLARANAHALLLGDRARFLCGDWAASVGRRFDLVLSNPPYVASEQFTALMRDVADYEPRSALDGGSGGLAAYQAILPALPALLTANGAAVLELGAGQFAPVAALATAVGLRSAARADLSGMPRAIILRPTP